ncbi:uncharacterized protein LOC114284477 [Camellia sinensis]|uniref:uncharacterized protein LOC114284477 n=1 Tax=Camellia sinensis TaxID=4442 RepID=UPI001035E96C|nr:uncharacterized protein LOC114284477 [Camellia sinensis]
MTELFVKSLWPEELVGFMAIDAEGSAGGLLYVKLKALKEALKVWNIEVFGNAEYKLKEAKDAMHALDLAAEERPLNDIEISRRREVKGEIWKLRKMKEWIWVQKSRVNWALKRDKNTMYFHIMATKRLSRNLMDSIIIKGTSYNNPQEMKREIARYFGEAFAEALRGWRIINDDILKFMADFHENGKLVKGLNASFVSLIPKQENPTSIQDYRPISLINSMYKILSKVLASRLKQVLPSIINSTQSAFLSGRSILDGILVANEVVDWWKDPRKVG